MEKAKRVKDNTESRGKDAEHKEDPTKGCPARHRRTGSKRLVGDRRRHFSYFCEDATEEKDKTEEKDDKEEKH